MSSEFKNSISQIKVEALSKKLILFIGSGVSYNSGLKSWNDLVKQFDKAIEYSIDEKEKYNTSELLRIPQYLYNKSPEKYFEILNHNFGCVPEKCNPIIDELLKLEPKHIITTNYDELIELSLKNNKIYGESIDEDLSKYHIVRADKDLIGAQKNNFLVKMHGDLKDIENMVLKENDYLRYSETHILIETFIKSLLIDHSFVFVGYSLSDYNLQLIMSWVDNIMIKHEGDSLYPRKKHFFINSKSQKLSIYEKKYFLEKSIEIVEFSECDNYKELDNKFNDLDDIGKNLLKISTYISKKKSNVDSITHIRKALNILASTNTTFILDIFNLFDVPLAYIKQVDNVLHLEICPNFSIVSECLVWLESEDDNEQSKLLKKIFFKAGCEFIQVNESNRIEVGKYENYDLFYFFMHFDFNYLNKIQTEYSSSTSKNEIMVSLFINAVFEDEKEKLNIEYIKLNEYFKEKKDFFNLLVVEHNKNILDIINDGGFFKLLKAIPKDIKPVLYLLEEYSNGFQSLILELAKIKSKYAKRFNPNTSSISTELNEIKNLSYKVFRTKLYNILRYLYNNCIITYRFGNYNHYITDFENIIYDFIDLGFQFISPLSNMRNNTDSFGGEGNYERTSLTNEDLFLSCYYLKNNDLNFLLKKHSIKKIDITQNGKEYLLLSFNNLILSYNFAYSKSSNRYLNILSNFISFFKCIEFTTTEYIKISKKILKVLKNIIFVEDDYNYVLSRDGMKTIIGFLYHLNLLNCDILDSKLILSLIEDILKNIIEKTREENKFIFKALEDYTLLENLSKLVKGEKFSKNINIMTLYNNDINKYLLSEFIEIFIQIYILTNKTDSKKINKILSNSIEKLSTSQLFIAVINKSLQYDSLIENKLYDLCNKYFKNAIIKEYLIENPLYCIARIYKRGIISDITPFKSFIGNFAFFDFVCMPEIFDYSNFDVYWSSWLELKKYRNIIIKQNFDVVKKKYDEAISNGATENIKATYYKYFY